MAPPLLQLPAIEAPRNALLDFSGINNAIDDWRKRNELETRKQDVRNIGTAWQNKDYDQATNLAFRSGDPQLAMHTQQMAQNQQQFSQQQRDYTEKKLAAAFQMIDKLPAEQRDAAHDRILALHPEAFQNSFKQLPEIWRNDRGMQRQFVIASALGPKDPAQQKALEASTFKDTQQGRLAGVQADTGKWVANDPTKPLFNVTTQQYAPQVPNQENPYEATRLREEAKKTGELEAARKNEIVTNSEGAKEYLAQKAYLESLIKQAENHYNKGGSAVFGPISGKEGYQTWRAVNPVGDKEALRLQQEIKATLSNMELSVAKMKLKGQGAVTENERLIARNTIGNLLSYDPDAARKILGSLDLEANLHLKKQGDFEKYGQRYVESNSYNNPNAPVEVKQIPPNAVRLLQKDPSPQAVQEFEAIFGKGTAKQFLRQ